MNDRREDGRKGGLGAGGSVGVGGPSHTPPSVRAACVLLVIILLSTPTRSHTLMFTGLLSPSPARPAPPLALSPPQRPLLLLRGEASSVRWTQTLDTMNNIDASDECLLQ